MLEPGAPQPRHGAGGSGQGTPGAARRSVAADPAAGTDQRRPGTSQQVNNCHAQDLLVCQDASSAVFFSRSGEEPALRLLARRGRQVNEWKRLNGLRIISVDF